MHTISSLSQFKLISPIPLLSSSVLFYPLPHSLSFLFPSFIYMPLSGSTVLQWHFIFLVKLQYSTVQYSKIIHTSHTIPTLAPSCEWNIKFIYTQSIFRALKPFLCVLCLGQTVQYCSGLQRSIRPSVRLSLYLSTFLSFTPRCHTIPAASPRNVSLLP